MNIQDKLERILRELHIMLSRAPVSEIHEEYVLVHKKEMQKTLGSLGAAVSEMMDHYEITEQARNRGELEAEKHRMEIIRNANQQAQDIYAASVMYSEDALGRIQRIIEEAEASGREMFKRLNREMAESKRVVRSNQLELITQLEDMKDSSKYMKLIEERNREIAKAKAQKKEKEETRQYQRKDTQEVQEQEEAAEETPIERQEEKIVYEKPVIKVNPEYFERAKSFLEEEAAEFAEDADAADEMTEEDKKEKHQRFFPFGRK
ncbi:MAG: hypothetical protein HFI84_03785 [Eubacterium sp.]|nr:hypothetical protein [Eubacterium sp.]